MPLKQILKESILSISFFAGKIFGKKIVNETICFFHSYAIGGAELVHLNIVKSLLWKPMVCFTGPSKTIGLLSEYDEVSDVVIFAFDRDIFNYAKAGFYAGRISKSNCKRVFGFPSHIFYSIVRCIKKDIVVVDILHAEIAVEVAPKNILLKIDKRVVIDRRTEYLLKEKYKTENCFDLSGRIVYVPNAVYIPSETFEKQDSPFEILFVGRNSYEKRLHLIGRVAEVFSKIYPDIIFHFVGPEPNIFKGARQNCRFYGEVVDRSFINSLYKRCHLLLIASSREGMPLVISESMAYGVVPIATSVGGISYIVKDGITGHLITQIEEDEIVDAMIAKIIACYSDKHELANLSHNCIDMAAREFSFERFNKTYKALFALDKTKPVQGVV